MTSKFIALMLCVALPWPGSSQTAPNNAYAITSKTNGSFEWSELKQINLANGEVVKNVFGNDNNSFSVYDGRSERPLRQSEKKDSDSANSFHPFEGLSAACAYDPKTNRIFYAPLFINQLRYVDLNTTVPSVFIFQNEPFSGAIDTEAEESYITRMVIGADGHGYAMSNNADHLVSFSTEKNPVINDFGRVHDAPENGDVSIHDANTSWGGDMLADAAGNLYLISAINHVFKINVQTRTATFITKIKNLPVSFTTNGAVVDEQGKIVLCSANYLTSYYSVDPYSWEASVIPSGNQLYTTSDLANGNFLFQNKISAEPVKQQKISLYPNPVKTSMFWLQFENNEKGKYNIQLTDITGRMISDRSVTMDSGIKTTAVRVDRSLAKGMYFVKVLNHQNKEVFTSKLMIE